MINDSIVTVMRECTAGSDAGRMTFPDVVAKLSAAGVERYHADLLRGEKTYYLPDGESLVIACTPLDGPPAMPFSAAGVDAAVRRVQAKASNYHEFCADIAGAGCVDYIVSLTGRRAVYFGRTGEAHVELFPSV